jgi:flagellar basal body L-ring protein FlgH
MSARSQVEKKIQSKQQEIADFEAQIEKAQAYIQAMQEVLRLLPREEGDAVSSEQLPRHGSAMAKTRDLLLETGKPMHITDILTGIGKENTKSQRLSVSGSLRSYARKGLVFTQEGGNVFGLVEFQAHNGNGRSPKDVPPKGFGLDTEEEAS